MQQYLTELPSTMNNTKALQVLLPKNAYKHPYTKKANRMQYPSLDDGMNKRYQRSMKDKLITKNRRLDRELKQNRASHESHFEETTDEDWKRFVIDTDLFHHLYLEGWVW